MASERRVAFIETIPEEGASGVVEELYEADRARVGYVANYTRLFAHQPAVYAAWAELNGAIKKAMDLRRYELATVAAARSLRSSYCALAHGKVLADQFLEPSTVRALVLDHRSAGLDAADVAVMDLAKKVTEDAASVTEDDIDRLRSLGLTDAEIFGVVVAAAARCFFSKTLDALGVQADPVYSELEPELREALTVGRPIAER
jgi:uncharacterized peroxidase-related enzyme